MVFTISVAPQTTMATIGISQIPRFRIELILSPYFPRRTTLKGSTRSNRLYETHKPKPMQTISNINCSMRSFLSGNFGGADRDRTGGLLVANQALSQLSYSPTA